MAEANPDLGTITDEAALLDSLFEEQGANPDDAGHAAPDAEVVTDNGDDGLAPDTPEDGAPPEGGDNPEPDPAAAKTFTVMIDGKEETVTQDELLAGYQRQADYTRKTQEAAQIRKQAEGAIGALKEQLAHWAVPQEAQPDWVQLAQTMDPREFQTAQAQWVERQQRQQQAQALHNAIQTQEHQTMMQREQAALLERVPEWRNPEVARGEMTAITTAAAAFGFTEADVAGCVDHRLILMARELSKLKVAQASLDKAKAAPTPPKAAIQGRAPQGDVAAKNAKLMENLKRTQSDDAAVALLLGG